MRWKTTTGAVAALSLGVALTSPTPVHAATPIGPTTPASISGTITNSAGTPLAGMCATAYPWAPQTAGVPPTGGVAAPPTSSTGDYTISGLRSGIYRVRFAACSGTGRFPLWYGQTPRYGEYGSAPHPIFVWPGQSLSGIDARLGPGSVVTGTVTDTSGTPIPGACVLGSITPGDFTDAVQTDASGSYSLPVRAGEAYTVQTNPSCQAGNYLPATYGAPTPVSAPLGQPTGGIDMDLQPGGTITGTITDPNGNPIPGACASAIGGASSHSVPADSSGMYEVDQLTSGTYHLTFRDCGAGNYHQFSYPTAVDVTAGQTTGAIDATLVPAGSISGTLTDQAGNPAAGVCAMAEETTPTGTTSSSAPASDASGHYRIDHLGTGTYTVSFSGCQNNWVPSWYKGAPYPSSATPVTVADGQDTPGVDDRVTLGGLLTGSITDTAGDPIPGCVSLYTSSGFQYGTNGSVQWNVGSLAPDTYKVEFSSCGSDRPFAAQWYDGKPDEASADPLVVGPGQQYNEIDAVVQLTDPVVIVSMNPPPGGQSSGGNIVVIRGQGFSGATSVHFGQASATFSVDSDNQITAVVPPGTANSGVNVSVTSPAGTSANSFRYFYDTTPNITSVSPDSGPWQGGTSIVVTGSGFTGTAGVSFGNLPARSFTVLDNSHLEVVTPTADIGDADLTVTAATGADQPVPTGVFHFTGPMATTATALSADPSPAAEGRAVDLTAFVTGDGSGAPLPTGAVTFFDGKHSLGQATVGTDGTAHLLYSPPEEGMLHLTASYGGDRYNLASVSSELHERVADASLQATGTTLHGTEGTVVEAATPVSGAVASFIDSDPGGVLGDYSATIDWGDGSTGTGSISASGAGWVVSGTHSYGEDGSYPIRVTINDAGGAVAVATGTAAVADPPDVPNQALDIASDLVGG